MRKCLQLSQIFFLIVIHQVQSHEGCMWKFYNESKIIDLSPLFTGKLNKASCILKCQQSPDCDVAAIDRNGDCLTYATFRDTGCLTNLTNLFSEQSQLYKKYKKSFNSHCVDSKMCATQVGLSCHKTKCICSAIK